MVDQSKRTRAGIRGALAQKLAAIGFGTGCCLAIWVYGQGNQEILAVPLAFWIGVSLWPDSNLTRAPTTPTSSKMILGRGFVILGIVASWTLAFVGMRVNSAPTKQPTRSETKTIESALLRAEEQYHQREFAKSLAVLDGLSVPSRFPLLQARRSHDRGIALLRLEKKAEAFECLAESLRLDTKNVEAACLLSEIALSKKDYVTARLYAERALAIDGRSTFAGALRGQIERSSVDRGKASKP